MYRLTSSFVELRGEEITSEFQGFPLFIVTCTFLHVFFFFLFTWKGGVTLYVDRKKRPLGHAPNIKRSTSTCVPTSPPTSDESIRQNHPLRLVINSRIKGRTFSYPFAQIAGTPAFSFAGVCFFSNFSVMASCRATSSSNNQCTVVTRTNQRYTTTDINTERKVPRSFELKHNLEYKFITPEISILSDDRQRENFFFFQKSDASETGERESIYAERGSHARLGRRWDTKTISRLETRNCETTTRGRSARRLLQLVLLAPEDVVHAASRPPNASFSRSEGEDIRGKEPSILCAREILPLCVPRRIPALFYEHARNIETKRR